MLAQNMPDNIQCELILYLRYMLLQRQSRRSSYALMVYKADDISGTSDSKHCMDYGGCADFPQQTPPRWLC